MNFSYKFMFQIPFISEKKVYGLVFNKIPGFFSNGTFLVTLLLLNCIFKFDSWNITGK